MLPGANPPVQGCTVGPSFGKPDLGMGSLWGAGGGQSSPVLLGTSVPQDRKKGGERWEITTVESLLSPHGGKQAKQKSVPKFPSHSPLLCFFLSDFSTNCMMWWVEMWDRVCYRDSYRGTVKHGLSHHFWQIRVSPSSAGAFCNAEGESRFPFHLEGDRCRCWVSSCFLNIPHMSSVYSTFTFLQTIHFFTIYI